MSDVAFFGGVLGPMNAFVDDDFTPEGMGRQRNLPQTATAWAPRGSGAGDERCEIFDAASDIALRADISQTCRPGDISYFAPPPAHVPAGQPERSKGDFF